MTARLHLADRPLGPAPWDPWETVCGLLCRETDDPSTLAADLDAVTCQRCRRSRLWRALDRAREDGA